MLSTYKTNAEQRAREFFSENYGPAATALIDGCWSNASLAMLSTNMLYFYPRQLAPNVIELGPMHIRNPEKLPQVGGIPINLFVIRRKDSGSFKRS